MYHKICLSFYFGAFYPVVYRYRVIVKSAIFCYRRNQAYQEKEAERVAQFEMEQVKGGDRMREPLISSEHSMNY